MPPRSVDPARLNGEALMNWYRRSPEQIERERLAADSQSYDEFFSRAPSHPTFDADRAWQDEGARPAQFEDALYHPSEGVELTEVGNPHNPRLRKEWEAKNGKTWPRDPQTGKPYDVSHIKPLADGGTNTLENIEPIHPDDHVRLHRERGDYSRWAKRAGIARAFGGRVARALPGLDIMSGFLGILSGRVRTDNWDNFTSDMLGFTSQEDWEKYKREHQREWNPNWKPGDPLIDPRYIA